MLLSLWKLVILEARSADRNHKGSFKHLLIESIFLHGSYRLRLQDDVAIIPNF